jgi:hypothetical protein
VPLARTYVAVVHCVADAAAAYAAHAAALATITSTAAELSGDEAGRKTSGDASVTFAVAGKAMTRESGTLALNVVVALQGSVVFAAAGGAGAVHAPAVAAVDAFVAQRHAVHPAL